MRGIKKRFGGVEALRGVDFTLEAREVHALVGENGAGKSTLMKVLSGAPIPDEGAILLEGRPLRLHSVAEAQREGIVMVYKELNLVRGKGNVAELEGIPGSSAARDRGKGFNEALKSKCPSVKVVAR